MRGIANRGDDCFVCAALQCVAHDAALCSHVRSAGPDAGPLTAALGAVLAELHDGGGAAGAVDPSGLRAALASSAPQFAGDGPGDASEFLAVLLSGLHDELRASGDASGGGGGGGGGGAWPAHWQANASKVAELRHGMQHVVSECPDCRQETHESSPFALLSLGVPCGGAAVDLRQCLGGWQLPAAPTYVFCSHCDDFRVGSQCRTIDRLPPVLTLHMNRLDDEGTLTTIVTCPETLSLEGASVGGGDAAQERTQTAYELFAVTHLAVTDSGTHYYSYCKVRCPSFDLRRAVFLTTCWSGVHIADG